MANSTEPKNLGAVQPRSIVEEMQDSYLDYAMSVIISRALPDVRDGLKPVHRRILYAMWTTGLRAAAKYKKSAAVVGEVLGKYHPHGDASVYDALVRMAQDFSMRYPLIVGQGNFGSMDGDSAAAMRYCVTADTRIVTERGLERIGDVADREDIDLRVLSKDRQVQQATKWFASGTHPTLRITTGKGYSITGSYNHLLLTWSKDPIGRLQYVWKRLDQLKLGDVAVLDRSETLWPKEEIDLRRFFPTVRNRRMHIKQLPPRLNADLAFILGSLCSEGTLGERKIEFCNTDENWIIEFMRRWKLVFPDCRLHIFRRPPSSYGRQSYLRLEIHSQHVIAFLRNIGLCPVKSAQRTLPETIFASPRHVVATFLQAYFEGDGTITSSKKMVELSCCSASGQLMQEIQTLLLRFGIDAFRRYDQYRTIHKLYIRNVDNYRRFREAIGFISERKQKKLDDVLVAFTKQSSKTDFIPFLSEQVRNLVGEDREHTFIRKFNFDRYDRLEQLHEHVAQAVQEKSEVNVKPLLEELLRNHYLFEPITLIEEAGPQEVFSIRVASDCHSFVGNGFINHNTEAKLSPIAEEILFDIDRETVDFQPNYDGSHKEPRVLPGKLPNLLLNGTVGIAVGMATNIPPHNLTELCDGLTTLLDHPDTTVEELMEHVKGPDFPTGGIIYNTKDIQAAYATGRGPVVIRAVTEIVEEKGGMRIIVSEIPFQVNKATLLEKIADLVREKKIEGIRDLRDESSKEGVRIVVELKRDAYPKKVLNRLFLSTDLQTTFHLNMLGLSDGIQPRVMNLKAILEEYIRHREVVVRRRTAYDLARAKERAHILEGLRIALLHIDKIIATIKKSQDREEAKKNLMSKFKLSDAQSVAILEMRLQQLANLERIKLEEEYKEKKSLIKELEEILASTKRIKSVIRAEVAEMKKKFGDERRTTIIAHGVKEFSAEDIIPNEATVVMITRDGYIKRLPPDTFKKQARGGKGVIGLTTKEEDEVEQLFSTTTHADLLFFTTRGRVFQLKAYDVPVASRTSKGTALPNFLQLGPGEKVSAVLPMSDAKEAKYLVMATRGGLIKKTELADFLNVRRSGLIAIKLKGDDQLQWVKPSAGSDEIAMVTAQGQSIRFSEKNVRPMGRAASGVRGIRLKKRGDSVIGMDVVAPELVKKDMLELFVVSANGFGKRTNLKEYRTQGRGGSGIKTMNVNPKTGHIIGGYMANAKDERDLMVISKKGQVIRIPFGSIKTQGRTTQGVRVMRFKDPKDSVASVAFI